MVTSTSLKTCFKRKAGERVGYWTRAEGGNRAGAGATGPLDPPGQVHLPCPTFRADAFRFRPLLSLLLSESESLSILSLAAAAVTAVTAMTPRSLSSSLPPAGSASGASLSEELTGWGPGVQRP